VARSTFFSQALRVYSATLHAGADRISQYHQCQQRVVPAPVGHAQVTEKVYEPEEGNFCLVCLKIKLSFYHLTVRMSDSYSLRDRALADRTLLRDVSTRRFVCQVLDFEERVQR